MMRITYDRFADAAYIYLVSETERRVDRTYVTDIEGALDMINLDFDADGKLLGIEVLSASQQLAEETLQNAEAIG